MNCCAIRDYLSAYLDGELTGWPGAPSPEAIEGHVLDCPECAAELASLRRTVDSLRSLGTDSPVRIDLSAEIGARIRQANPEAESRPAARVHRLPRAWAVLVTAAAAALLVIASVQDPVPVGRAVDPVDLGRLPDTRERSDDGSLEAEVSDEGVPEFEEIGFSPVLFFQEVSARPADKTWANKKLDGFEDRLGMDAPNGPPQARPGASDVVDLAKETRELDRLKSELALRRSTERFASAGGEHTRYFKGGLDEKRDRLDDSLAEGEAPAWANDADSRGEQRLETKDIEEEKAVESGQASGAPAPDAGGYHYRERLLEAQRALQDPAPGRPEHDPAVPGQDFTPVDDSRKSMTEGGRDGVDPLAQRGGGLGASLGESPGEGGGSGPGLVQDEAAGDARGPTGESGRAALAPAEEMRYRIRTTERHRALETVFSRLEGKRFQIDATDPDRWTVTLDLPAADAGAFVDSLAADFGDDREAEDRRGRLEADRKANRAAAKMPAPEAPAPPEPLEPAPPMVRVVLELTGRDE